MTVSALETYRDAAIAALVAADYDTAIQQALAAKMMLATAGDVSRSAGGNRQEISWSRSEIDRFISECRLLQSQAAHEASTGGPFRQMKVTYTRAETTS